MTPEAQFVQRQRVLIDANVLAYVSVADLLLRLPKRGLLFWLLWSEEILAETLRTYTKKFGWKPDAVVRRIDAMRSAFPEASVSGYEKWVDQCTNDEGDRHVLAAAIEGQAQVIVTFNYRHFKEADLAPWGIRAIHPKDYLLNLYRHAPQKVATHLAFLAEKWGKSDRELLEKYARDLPNFAHAVLSDMAKRH